MDNFIFLLFYNRPDLLQKAYTTAKMVSDTVIILDNSPKGDCPLPAVRYPVPYTFAQSQNWARKHAIENACSHYYYIHSDCEADEITCKKLKDKVQTLQEEKWGVVFTLYDTLCAFSTVCVKDIGEWDVDFPLYFCDNDYYHRMQLAGYKKIESNLTTQHVGSAYINATPTLKLKNSITFPIYSKLYHMKWKGEPGKEQFTCPYNWPT